MDHFAFDVPLSLVIDDSVLQATEEVQQQAAAALATTTLSPRSRCHIALTSEAQASPRVDVGDTPFLRSSTKVKV